jgi:hypothetical protein
MKPAIEVIVYFVDPKDLWAQKVTQVAIIYRITVPGWFPWQRRIARALARGNCGNTGNCCWLVRDAATGALLEQETARTPLVSGL